jgi:hypothetical protein
MRRSLVLAMLFAVAATGCFRTTIKSGEPVSPARIEWDERWHHGLIYGLAELSGPYDLSKVCPKGWAEVHTELPFVQGLVQAITFNVYSPQSVTIRCSE